MASPILIAKRRILICDPHPLIRRGIASLIATTPDLCVCGEAPDFAATIAQLRQVVPDVLVADWQVGPGRSAGDALRQLSELIPTPIVLFTADDDQDRRALARGAGAYGFVSKSQSPAALLGAIRAALAGDQWAAWGNPPAAAPAPS